MPHLRQSGGRRSEKLPFASASWLNVALEWYREEKAHGDLRPFASVAGREEAVTGRHRETHGSAVLLHLARGERPHGSHGRNAGEDGACARSAALPTLLRRRGSAKT